MINKNIDHIDSHKESHKKRESILKYIGFIYLDPLPPPHNKDINNKDILASCLTPSLLPELRTSEFFGGVTEDTIRVDSIENPWKLSNKKLKWIQKGAKRT